MTLEKFLSIENNQLIVHNQNPCVVIGKGESFGEPYIMVAKAEIPELTILSATPIEGTEYMILFSDGVDNIRLLS